MQDLARTERRVKPDTHDMKPGGLHHQFATRRNFERCRFRRAHPHYAVLIDGRVVQLNSLAAVDLDIDQAVICRGAVVDLQVVGCRLGSGGSCRSPGIDDRDDAAPAATGAEQPCSGKTLGTKVRSHPVHATGSDGNRVRSMV